MSLRILFASVETLAFAGGGNRCGWQAGVIERLREADRHDGRPSRPVPASTWDGTRHAMVDDAFAASLALGRGLLS